MAAGIYGDTFDSFPKIRFNVFWLIERKKNKHMDSSFQNTKRVEVTCIIQQKVETPISQKEFPHIFFSVKTFTKSTKES
jgi:hypothetical protein